MCGSGGFVVLGCADLGDDDTQECLPPLSVHGPMALLPLLILSLLPRHHPLLPPRPLPAGLPSKRQHHLRHPRSLHLEDPSPAAEQDLHELPPLQLQPDAAILDGDQSAGCVGLSHLSGWEFLRHAFKPRIRSFAAVFGHLWE